MSALERPRPRAISGGEGRDQDSEGDGHEQAVIQAASVTWSYTLAHAGTPLRARALSEGELGELAETLRARGVPLPAGFASPRARARLASGASRSPRYIWGFTALDDALRVARANRRSDYHAYPEPASLREASLDRLYRRFPLDEFPRATVILFSGAPVCPDPLLGPDPAPGSLAADLAAALGPEAWERYTLLGLRQGASLIRVMPTDRWVRLSPRALEEAWETAGRALAALPEPGYASGDSGEESAGTAGSMDGALPARAPRAGEPDPERRESAAFQALLRILTTTSPSDAAPPPLPTLPPRQSHSRARKPRRPMN